MYLIGTMFFKLKKFAMIPVVFSLLCWVFSAQAFERALTDNEVAKLEENAKEDPQNVVARRFLIDHFAKESKWDKVILYGQASQKDLPAASLLLVAKAYISNGDGVGASGATGLYNSKFPATVTSKILEGQAILFLARKERKDEQKKIKAQEALDIFKQAAQMSPKEPAAYLSWIGVLREFWPNSAEDALHVYKILENNTQNFTDYLAEKCELFIKANWWDQALTVCQRSVKKNVDHIESYIYLAEAQKIKKDAEAAKATLLKVLESNPKSARAHFVLANMYFEENNFISASEHYQSAINNGGGDPVTYLGLAKSEYQLKKYDSALQAYKKNCTLNRAVASEFRNASGQLRSNKNIDLHNKYKNVMSSCR